MFWTIAIEHYVFEQKTISKDFFKNFDAKVVEHMISILERITGEVLIIGQKPDDPQTKSEDYRNRIASKKRDP